MSLLSALLLALIEGITEFLPVSSTGHMILAAAWLPPGDPGFTNAFLVIVQLPAIFAVVLYFRRQLWPFQGMSWHPAPGAVALWARVMTAFLPAAVLGVLLDDLIDRYLFRPGVVAAALFVGGVILIVLEKKPRKVRFTDPAALPFRTVLAVGLFQCLAMIPGTSRSAATIIGAMVLGVNRAAAAEFSFFLAIPTLAGAAGLKTLKAGLQFTPAQWGLLVIGCALSFLTAYGVVAVFMNYIRRYTFIPFAWYRILLAAVVVLALVWFG
ncbi:MAG TPA: undecaprenyl-diphosphate phosphatase [Candidatus Hydrogenedentes bacterium]|nr:undecaprenyl-diphosphate phosphatase [Candidatus Hydrogenedentota bacterium]HOJ68304.1 undecaprenyl-diphosphate phosphatase [Candidatus Hydrogenedentota bacterium]HOV61838.1 undecaprenyl-diphosphate phosphatase [Candidatus Hydrogenedentota bacterium]